MKLDEFGAILKISDMSFLEEKHIVRYAPLFEDCMRWLVRNDPGTCTVDLRLSEDFSDQMDARFFTLDSSGTAKVLGRPNPKIHLLEKQFSGSSIAFVIKPLDALCGKVRLSFDWIASDKKTRLPQVPVEKEINFSKYRMRLSNTFFVADDLNKAVLDGSQNGN